MTTFCTHRWSAVAVLSVLALLASGCAAKEMPDPISAADLTAADIKDSGEKLTPDELIENWEKVSEETCAGDINKDSEPVKFAECSDAAIMYSFPDANDTREEVLRLHELHEGFLTADLLVGPNWIINNPENREALFDEIGGIPVTTGG